MNGTNTLLQKAAHPPTCEDPVGDCGLEEALPCQDRHPDLGPPASSVGAVGSSGRQQGHGQSLPTGARAAHQEPASCPLLWAIVGSLELTGRCRDRAYEPQLPEAESLALEQMHTHGRRTHTEGHGRGISRLGRSHRQRVGEGKHVPTAPLWRCCCRTRF